MFFLKAAGYLIPAAFKIDFRVPFATSSLP